MKEIKLKSQPKWMVRMFILVGSILGGVFAFISHPMGETSANNPDGTSDFMHYETVDGIGTISVCDPASNGENCITMMDRNLGASKAGTECSETDTGACGTHYQWGNNHGFEMGCFVSGCTDTVVTSATKDKASWNDNYNNYGYNGPITNFMKGWYDYWENNKHYDNLWGGVNDRQLNNRGFDNTGNVVLNLTGRQGLCDIGYHIPSQGERGTLLKYWAANYTGAGNILDLIYSNGLPKFSSNFTGAVQFKEDFKIPFAGDRDSISAEIFGLGKYASFWSSSPYEGFAYARFLHLENSSATTDYYYDRAFGFSVRCFKDEYLSYSSGACPEGKFLATGDVCITNEKDIVIQATATSANQTLTINKYFANAFTVDRGDGTTGNLTSDTTHTYNTAGTYTITLSLAGTATRWTFQNVSKPLVPVAGTTVTGVKIIYMPSLANGFGNSATTPGSYFFRHFNYRGSLISLPGGSFDTTNITTAGDYFFYYFNYKGSLTSLPGGSFDTSNITTVGNYFFYSFNNNGSLTSLPGGSFRLSTGLTTAANYFFYYFNYSGSLTSLPEWSFDTSNITKAGTYFFSYFNGNGSLTSLPGGSFDTSNITTAGSDFFSSFNRNGALTSLPGGSFRLSTGLTTAEDSFFSSFNDRGSLTSLPGGSFDTSKITTAGTTFFHYFNSNGALTSLPGGSFRLSTGLTTVGNNFFSSFNNSGSLTSLPEGSFDTSNITTAGSNFFISFNDRGSLSSLPGGSFDTSNITTAGNNFFSSFNDRGSLTSLPECSFRLSTGLTTARDSFFHSFNDRGSLTSLPEGSFDTSNITTAGNYFFYYFNYSGSLTSLPDSFKLTSAAYNKTDGYQNAFNSPNYTLNKNVSDLVSGVVAPADDRNTFSDNQPGRCGVHPNWLDTTANACSITYDSNGGSTIANLTQLYTADTTGVVAGSGVTTPTRANSQFVGWYTGIQTGNQVITVLFPSMDSGTLYAFWSCDTGYKISGDQCVPSKDIVLQATATAANQTLKINKYFANAYTVDRGDGTTGNLTSDTIHTYNTAGTYTITLSLAGTATRWTFQNVSKPLVPVAGTTVTGVKIIYMPALADGFGNSATTPGNYFFRNFNNSGNLTSLPEGSFDTSNITTAGNHFFSNFNYNGALTSLPAGSFRLSTGLTMVGDYFFGSFNRDGVLTSLPAGSFNTSNLTSVGNGFFSNFNDYGALESLPEYSFDISNISGSVGYSFFFDFNYGGKIMSLPTGSFDVSNITSIGSGFFYAFNAMGKITNLPTGSFDTSNITSVGDDYFAYFNMMGSLTSLPEGSFRLSTGLNTVSNNFFFEFNTWGELVSLPEGSFNTNSIITAGDNFFQYFNYDGKLESLPDGSFDTSNITIAGDYFFGYFNYSGALEELPESFIVNSTGAIAENGYKNAFNSIGYTINKKVSDLVSGVTVPLGDMDTFSDNQSGRCGVDPNWLVTTADACSITYDSNGGGTDLITKKYTSDTTGVNAGDGISVPVIDGLSFDGWYTDPVGGELVENVIFPSMDGDTLYAHWVCGSGYHLEDGVCTGNTKNVLCIESGAPENAIYVPGSVTILRDTGTNTRSIVDNCSWYCDEHYHTGVNGNTCDIDTYTITFVDGSGKNADMIWTGEYGSETSGNIDFPLRTKNGYTLFWSRDIPDVVPAENIVITAIWTKKQSGGNGGGGGGGSSLKKDNCPDGDYSDSYYDGTCGKKPIEKDDEKDSSTKPQNNQTGHNSADEIVYDTLTFNPHYSDEMNKAYQYSYHYGITTKNNIRDAAVNQQLTRIAMAKMLSQYAINVLGIKPDATRNNEFADVSDKLDTEYCDGVTLAYQLGIMGINMPNNKFMPYNYVTRAEFATALSRLLYKTSDGEYEKTSKYFVPHINKLAYEGILTNTDPYMKELRGYVMLMLMRSAK